MKLQTNAKKITLKGSDDCFKNTKYQDLDFSITLKELTKAQNYDIYTKCTKIVNKKEETDFMKLAVEQLKISVENWENFDDENGNKIELTSENISALYDYENELFQIVLLESSNYFSKKK